MIDKHLVRAGVVQHPTHVLSSLAKVVGMVETGRTEEFISFLSGNKVDWAERIGAVQ